MTSADARAFAEQWTAAWNALDLDRVLAHFHEEVGLTSPTAAVIVGVATVRGKQALREYWKTGSGESGHCVSPSSACHGIRIPANSPSSTTLSSAVGVAIWRGLTRLCSSPVRSISIEAF